MSAPGGEPIAPGDEAPALEGELGRFVASDVLQFLKLAGATGRVEFERAGERIEVGYARGRPLWGRTTGRSVRLGDVMVHRHGLAPEDLRAALEEQRQRPGEPLGRLLHERGAGEEQVLAAVAEVFRRIVCLLSLWPDGRFRFTPGPEAEPDDAGLEFELDRLILEGLHQADLAHGIA